MTAKASYDPFNVKDSIITEVERELLLVPDDSDDFYATLTDESGLQELPDQEWVIDGWVPRGGYSIVFGPAGTGKTLILLGMAKGVSRGKRWQHAQCRHGAVLFLEGEGLAQLKQRSAAWDETYPRTGSEKGVFFTETPLDLTKAESVAQILRTLRKVEANEGCKVELVVVDPLAEFMTGDENTSGMAAASKSLRVLAKLADCAIAVGHHSPHDGNRERGYTMLRDKALVSMGVERRLDGLGVVQRKNRHAARKAIHLYFKVQGDSVVVEHDSTEMTDHDYDAERDERRKASAENKGTQQKQRQTFNSQRALNIVRSVVGRMAPDEVLTQNKLVDRCMDEAASEHAANPGFDKIGRTLIVGHILALAAEGAELVVEKKNQAKLYRSGDQACT